MSINSKSTTLGEIQLLNYTGHISMLPFDLSTLEGLPQEFVPTVKSMLANLDLSGTAYFTIHGKTLEKGQTHRRPGPHTDGNYEPCSWGKGGGNGWKVGENGPPITTQFHHDSYLVETGGIILASNFKACKGWNGIYNGTINVGGDCSKFDLSTGEFELQPNTIYYGNNHFIHESLPMSDNIHRVLARITLPQNHIFKG